MFHLKRRPYMTTGIIEPLDEFLSADDRREGKQPSRRRRDGDPVSSVEVLMQVEEFGRKRTAVHTVEVPDAAIKVTGPGQVVFDGLTVSPWTRKDSSIINYSFRADAVAMASDEDREGGDDLGLYS